MIEPVKAPSQKHILIESRLFFPKKMENSFLL